MDQQQEFSGWADVEVMGRQRFAGLCRSARVGGATMLQIDVPEVGPHPAFTKLLGSGSIFCVTPCSEEQARKIAAYVRSPMIADAFSIERHALQSLPSAWPTDEVPWLEPAQIGQPVYVDDPARGRFERGIEDDYDDGFDEEAEEDDDYDEPLASPTYGAVEVAEPSVDPVDSTRTEPGHGL